MREKLYLLYLIQNSSDNINQALHSLIGIQDKYNCRQVTDFIPLLIQKLRKRSWVIPSMTKLIAHTHILSHPAEIITLCIFVQILHKLSK